MMLAAQIITAEVDLGQVIIASLLVLISVIGWFIRKDIDTFNKRLDKHEERLLDLSNTLSIVTGKIDIITKFFRKSV